MLTSVAQTRKQRQLRQGRYVPQVVGPQTANEGTQHTIASATRGMHWIVVTANPRARVLKWRLKRESVSYVDAFMEMHNVVNDGLYLMVIVSPESSEEIVNRLNRNVAD